jgi:EAL domain-containing protein (putative c-di-GMP-specific phosphodiesterase class I)
MSTPTLSKLRELGVQLALDDFGTGYASLGEIQRFPLDYIKIGWPFTRELAPASRAEAIVDAVARMCHGLGMRSVAEGIESARQLELVRGLGYDFVQGFHLMRPITVDAVRRLVDPGSQARGGSEPIQIAAGRSLLERHGHQI